MTVVRVSVLIVAHSLSGYVKLYFLVYVCRVTFNLIFENSQ